MAATRRMPTIVRSSASATARSWSCRSAGSRIVMARSAWFFFTNRDGIAEALRQRGSATWLVPARHHVVARGTAVVCEGRKAVGGRPLRRYPEKMARTGMATTSPGAREPRSCATERVSWFRRAGGSGWLRRSSSWFSRWRTRADARIHPLSHAGTGMASDCGVVSLEARQARLLAIAVLRVGMRESRGGTETL